MTRYLLTSSLFLFLTITAAQAGGVAQLQSLVKNETLDDMVVNLTLSTPASARLEVSGQRIDLFLAETTVSPALGQLPQDGSILRLILAKRDKELMVSFLLSRPPREARIVTGGDARDLTLQVDWDARTKGIRPAIIGHLRGIPRVGEHGHQVRVAATSGFTSHWQDFYLGYRAPMVWRAGLRYTMPAPPEPVASQAASGSPAASYREAWRLGMAGRWSNALVLLKRIKVADLAPEDRQPFFLLYGTALCQESNGAQARELYQQFVETSPNSAYLNHFRLLLAWDRARAGDSYGAASAITVLGGEPLRVDGAELLLAEIRLVTGQPEEALARLEQLDINGDSRLCRARLLRLADARAVLGRYRQALRGYREWLLREDRSQLDGFSLAQLAACLDELGEWREAEQTYIRLAGLVREPAAIALSLYGAARTAAKRGEVARSASRCAEVRRQYGGTEGALRAWLLELDLLMTGKNKAGILKRSGEYGVIAGEAPSRELREEASFKHALTVLLFGDTEQGLQLLQAFRRDFASGALLVEAEALTLEYLEPLVLGQLREGKEVEALALVEQNRNLLATRALPPHFATAVAEGFRNLGLLERAASVYGYLLEDAKGKPEAEQYYLPMVEILEDAGRYHELVGKVSLYRQGFPTGPSLSALLLVEGRAFLALGRLDEAVALLPELRGKSPEVLDLRNRLLLTLATGDSKNSGAMQGLLTAKTPRQRAGTKLLQAERLLKEGEAGQALEIYQQLVAADSFADQARYRSAQICLQRGERQRGVNFLNELVDKGNDRHWQALAREMLALSEGG